MTFGGDKIVFIFRFAAIAFIKRVALFRACGRNDGLLIRMNVVAAEFRAFVRNRIDRIAIIALCRLGAVLIFGGVAVRYVICKTVRLLAVGNFPCIGSAATFALSRFGSVFRAGSVIIRLVIYKAVRLLAVFLFSGIRGVAVFALGSFGAVFRTCGVAV